MESAFDYTSREEDAKPSHRQLNHKMRDITGYQPGSGEYREASLEIAKQLADHVSEDNSDATYEEVMDIDSDSFELLDDAEANHLLNHEQRSRIEDGDFSNFTEMYAFPGGAYDSSQGGYHAGKMAAEDSKNPDKGFAISSDKEFQEFREHVGEVVQDAFAAADIDNTDRFMQQLDKGFSTHI